MKFAVECAAWAVFAVIMIVALAALAVEWHYLSQMLGAS